MFSLPTWSLHAIDVLFFGFHTALILFNLVGWVWPQTRRLHFFCIAGTLFSWVAMGAFYGFGYCLCTDWHFQVRRSLGLPVFGQTYLQLTSQVFLGIELSQTVSNLLAGGGLLLILLAMVVVGVRQRWQRKSPGA
jgi:Protein of Unknown function (DUF2784)